MKTYAITIKHQGDDWWLAKIVKNPKYEKPVYQWSSLKEDAITYESKTKAEQVARQGAGNVVAHKACPQCHGLMSDHPALSRKDNKTKICTRCGIKEALADFEASAKEAQNGQH